MPWGAFPWILVCLGLVAGGFSFASNRSRARVGHLPLVAAGFIAGLGLPALAAIIVSTMFPDMGGLIHWIGMGGGALAATASVLLFDWAKEEGGGEAAAAGFSGLAAYLLTGAQKDLAGSIAFSYVLGLCAATLCWAYLGYRRVALASLLPAVALAAACGLSAFRSGDLPMAPAIFVGLAAAFSGLISLALNTQKEKLKGFDGLASVILFGAICAGMAAAPGAAQEVNEAGHIGVIAAVMALVCDWAFARDSKYKAVAGVLWLSAAAFAFSQLQGYGIAISVLAGSVGLLLARRSDLLGSLAPLAGFALYRLFLEASGESARAFDIGQHYGMIGLLGGFLLVNAVTILLDGITCDCKIPLLKGVLAACFLAGGLIGAGLVLGDKGIAGLLIGAGIPAATTALDRGRVSLAALAIGLGSMALVALSFKGLLPYLELPREAKQTALVLLGLFAAAPLATLIHLNRFKAQVTTNG